jgi:hypothetical protein
LENLKAEEEKKDNKAETQLEKARQHALVEGAAIKFGPEKCSGKKCVGYRGRVNKTRSGAKC